MALANATVNSTRIWSEGQLTVVEKTLSGLTAAALVTLPVSDGFSNLAPRHVDFVVTTKPTDGSDVYMSWESTDANTASDSEIDLRFKADGGGSLGGCVLKVMIKFLEGARQDRQSIASDNNT